MKRFWNFIKNKATEIEPEKIELRIEGEIVDDSDIWMYEWFGELATAPNDFKDQLKEFKNKDITVWVDSIGGSVFAAASIYNALKEHDGKITVKIDKAFSAASVIAMAGDDVLMSPTALLMIHNPMTGASGDMHVMRKVADVLDTVKESIINAYVTKTGQTKEYISNMMDQESWMSANVAVKEGFANGLLYQDEPIKVENLQEFSFNRLQIANSTTKSIEKVVASYKKVDDDLKDQLETEKEKLLLELDLI